MADDERKYWHQLNGQWKCLTREESDAITMKKGRHRETRKAD